MERKDLILAALSPAQGKSYSPVQVQKLFFLIDQNIPQAVGGQHFHFTPYDYGPFDPAVYQELNELAEAGFIESRPVVGRTWSLYQLSEAGQQRGQELFNRLPREAQTYLIKVSSFVRSLSFAQLVSAIYKAYPDMKENSVFKD